MKRLIRKAINIKADLKRKINKEFYEFCRQWHEPKELAQLNDRLYNEYGLSYIIMGYPHEAQIGSKSWTVQYEINGEVVENSNLVYSVYEGNDDSLRNEYNIYLS